ncbi:MAG: heme exporter protein CcmD [Boseongicola sp.]|nr:heme exporter protein CcmD [Boseongicola sp.]
MMVDLGKYTVEVGLAYGVSAVLLVAIIALSISQGRRAKKELDKAEARWRDG